MARRRGLDQQIQITRGFMTEFTPVAFPREAAIDVDNCVIDSDGSIRRRPGIDLEQQFQLNSINGGVLTATQLEEIAFSTHLWEFVSNSGTLNIVVQQIGLTLQFYAQFGAVSSNLLGELDMTPHAVNIPELNKTQVQVASGLGNLYIVSEFLEPIKVSYDGTTFTATEITISIRDFEGLEDGLKIDERPGNLKRSHYYNLRNQGWTDENILKFAGVSTGTDLCLTTGTAAGLSAQGGNDFPSNVDIMTTGIVTDSGGNLVFDGDFIRNGFQGNTPAAKGHFILNAFNQDLDAALDCPGTGNNIFVTRPEAVAFHQGRAFYTTPTVQNKIGGVFYSQQLTVEDKDGNCFQEADPTAADINDLVPTDGGFLPMPGVGQIYTLRELGNGIVVIASNGIYYITGSSFGSGFSAVDLRLDKASKVGALSASTVVEAENSLFYFGIDGIMQVTSTEGSGLNIANITQASIQEFYINISAQARETASVVYIPEQRKIFWAYRDSLAATNTSTRSYDKYLILDFEIQGFYKYSIGNSITQNFPEIVGLTLVKPLTEGVANTPVLELDGVIVTENDGSNVTDNSITNSGQITQLKSACLAFSSVDDGYKMTFATFHSRSFTDWRDVDNVGAGLPMVSFIDFAEFNMEAVHTKGKPTYVHSFYEKTSKNLEPGGYYELPPLFYESKGLRVSQSVLEVLNKPSSNMRCSQSVLEAVVTVPSDFVYDDIETEVLWTY